MGGCLSEEENEGGRRESFCGVDQGGEHENAGIQSLTASFVPGRGKDPPTTSKLIH